ESTDRLVPAAAETVGAAGWILLALQEIPTRHATTKALGPVVMPALSIGLPDRRSQKTSVAVSGPRGPSSSSDARRPCTRAAWSPTSGRDGAGSARVSSVRHATAASECLHRAAPA